MKRRIRGAGPETGAAQRRLWAPWRSAYLRSSQNSGARCIFCFRNLSDRGRHKRLVLFADRLALVMLNRYPYNSGHLMVAPRRHIASPELLTAQERTALSELVAAAVAKLRSALKPAGFNLGANLGRSAGAGFADHMHWHVVPRWEGDTNFMPVTAEVRVISQHLEETFALLDPLFNETDFLLQDA